MGSFRENSYDLQRLILNGLTPGDLKILLPVTRSLICRNGRILDGFSSLAECIERNCRMALECKAHPFCAKVS
jgi:hypothetical protein